MVSDVHRTLLYGGLFLYPANRGAPCGKLRLLHEAAPIAFLAVNAGALADSGAGSLLDATPAHARELTPVAIGSHDDVRDYLAFLRRAQHAQPHGNGAAAEALAEAEAHGVSR
jgi:fructose-1,6-bisphosphatase I